MRKLAVFAIGMICATVLFGALGCSKEVEQPVAPAANPAPEASLTLERDEVVPLLVNYSLPIEMIIGAGGPYKRVSWQATSEYFPATVPPNDVGVKNVDFHIFQFKEAAQDYQVGQWMKEHGFRPATIYEVATYGINSTLFGHVVSVGCSYWKDEKLEKGYQILFSCYYGTDWGKELVVGWSDSNHHTDTKYVGVPQLWHLR